jgi:hypothetical protein
MVHRGWRILSAGTLGVLAALATMAGCQPTGSTTGPGGTGGEGTGGATTGSNTGGSDTTTGTNTTGSNTTTGTGGGGTGGGGGESQVVTIQDVTTGKVGPSWR